MSWSDSENYKSTKAANYKALFFLCIFLCCLVLKFCDGTILMPGVRRVTVSLDVPEQLTVPLFTVSYHSKKCKQSRRDGNFKKYYIDDSNVRSVEPEREEGTRIYSVTVPVEKGWYCDWKLSNIDFKLRYKRNIDIMKGIDETISERITFVFDDHYPRATNGLFEVRHGRSKEIIEEFYPVKTVNHLVGNRVDLSFTGRKSFLTYRFDSDIERVIFRPVLHTGKLVNRVYPPTWGEGEYVQLIYPDGSVDYGDPFPDFERLQIMSYDSEK